jgi:hypothetical protein
LSGVRRDLVVFAGKGKAGFQVEATGDVAAAQAPTISPQFAVLHFGSDLINCRSQPDSCYLRARRWERMRKSPAGKN